jgi:hypothetical protein
MQYNNLNIGEGCIISVTRASFNPATVKKETVTEAEEATGSTVSLLFPYIHRRKRENLCVCLYDVCVCDCACVYEYLCL